MNPTHLFPGQPPEVDFLIQKLANFCAVGPAITRARAHSTSRGRGVLIGQAAPVGAGRAAAVGCCWLLCRASGQEIGSSGGALSAAHLAGCILIGAALRSAQGEAIRSAAG